MDGSLPESSDSYQIFFILKFMSIFDFPYPIPFHMTLFMASFNSFYSANEHISGTWE